MTMSKLISATTSGILAGASGATALNAFSYLLQGIPGTPASNTPQQSVEGVADAAGVEIPGRGDELENRVEGFGPLTGYAVGLGVGAIGGALRGLRHQDPDLAGPRGAGPGRDGHLRQHDDRAEDHQPEVVDGCQRAAGRRAAPRLWRGHHPRPAPHGRPAHDPGQVSGNSGDLAAAAAPAASTAGCRRGGALACRARFAVQGRRPRRAPPPTTPGSTSACPAGQVMAVSGSVIDRRTSKEASHTRHR